MGDPKITAADLLGSLMIDSVVSSRVGIVIGHRMMEFGAFENALPAFDGGIPVLFEGQISARYPVYNREMTSPASDPDDPTPTAHNADHS